MSAAVLSLLEVRLRRLAERFLTLQTAIDDGGPRADLSSLEAELERVIDEVTRLIAQPRADEERFASSQADHRELSRAVVRAIGARRLWCEVQRESGAGARADDAADAFTLALIELALRLRGRPRRATAAQR